MAIGSNHKPDPSNVNRAWRTKYTNHQVKNECNATRLDLFFNLSILISIPLLNSSLNWGVVFIHFLGCHAHLRFGLIEKADLFFLWTSLLILALTDEPISKHDHPRNSSISLQYGIPHPPHSLPISLASYQESFSKVHPHSPSYTPQTLHWNYE